VRPYSFGRLLITRRHIAISFVSIYITGTAFTFKRATAYSEIEVKMQDQKPTETDTMAGRKPEDLKSTNVRLPPEMMEKIDEIAGPGRRAKFIRDAVDHVLKLMDRVKRYREDD
jgi:hypothetical protein